MLHVHDCVSLFTTLFKDFQYLKFKTVRKVKGVSERVG